MNSTPSVVTPEVLATFVPMNVLSGEHRQELLNHATVVSLAPGESLDASAEHADYTYYLLDGVFNLVEGERVLETMSAGDDSARFAINRLRSERISGRATDLLKLLRVDISLVSTLLLWMQSLAAASSRSLRPEDSAGWLPRVLSSELFARIPPANIQGVFNHLESIETKAEQVIIKQGESGDYYYIVRSGKCAVTREVEPAAAPVLLASLGPGDSFGEEALLSNAKRNATITMVGDGELMRLTKEDFRQLITAPLVNTLNAVEATEIVNNGAAWVDVRLREEHANNGIPESINLPLQNLRENVQQLNKEIPYVTYSDSAGRSRARAFLLNELGFTAYVLEGGLVANSELAHPQTVSSPPSSAKKQAEPIPLSDLLTQADQDLEVALQDKLEATTVRRLWVDELAQSADKETNARLRARQKKLELESQTASAALAQAQRKNSRSNQSCAHRKHKPSVAAPKQKLPVRRFERVQNLYSKMKRHVYRINTRWLRPSLTTSNGHVRKPKSVCERNAKE